MLPPDTAARSACPTEAELRAFDQGYLADAEIDRVSMHLESGCPQCAAVLARLESGPDPFADELRSADRGPADELPAAIGRYRVAAELGRGGMGVVYRAVDPGTGRTVAVKCLLGSPALDPRGAARFKQEVKALARVTHPHVVRLYDYDLDGNPIYLVMEFVGGEPLEKKLAGRPLPPREAAALLEKVARAVHAVHRAGLLHRDLKPANVLLTPEGEPKVSDFGLARAADAADERLTLAGTALGTPQYMPPEQACGDGALTRAGDVYALGAVLYELLTGRPPFQGPTPHSVIDQVRHAEPVPPTRLQPGVSRDLETVCLKCLRKESRRRYASAEDLADDLRRFLEDRPVLARRAGGVTRAWRWCRRNPVVAGLVTAVAVVLLAGTAGSTALAVWGWREARRADGEAATARASETRAVEESHRATQAERDARRDRDALERTAYRLTIREADREWLDDRADKALALLARCPEHLRGWEWHFLKRRCGTDEALIGRHGGMVAAIAATPDGGRVYTVGHDGFVRAWDPAMRQEVGPPLRVCHPGTVRAAFDRSARRVAVHQAGISEIAVWSLDARRPVRAVPWDGEAPPRLALSPDGTLLAAGNTGGFDVTVWDVGTGDSLWSFAADNESNAGPGGYTYASVSSLAFSPDGRRVAVGTRDRVAVWDVRRQEGRWSGRAYFRSPGREHHAVSSVAFAGRIGEWVVSGGYFDPRVPERAELLVHRPPDAGVPPRVLANDLRRYEPLAVSGDGSRVAYATGQRVVVVREVETGQEVVRVRTTGPVASLAFTPDGQHLLVCAGDGEVQRWSTSQSPATEIIRLDDARGVEPTDRAAARSVLFPVWGVAPDPEAVHLCLWDRDAGGTVRLVPSGARSPKPPALALSARGETLVVGQPDGTIHLWVWQRRKQVGVLTGLTGRATLVAVIAGGRVIGGTLHGGIRVWDRNRPDESREFYRPGRPLTSLAASPDGGMIAVGCEDERGGEVTVLRAETGAVVHRLPIGSRKADALAFGPDGSRLAVTTSDPAAVQVWDWKAGTRLAEAADPHDGAVAFVRYTPDGRRFLTGSDDGKVKVWDADQCSELLVLRGHTAAVHRGAALPDGLVITASWDDSVRVWDGRPTR